MRPNAAIFRSASRKRDLILQQDLEEANVLAAQRPDPSMLYSFDEIATLVEDLMGIAAPRDHEGRILDVRPKGHWFEFEIARRLGYHYPPASGVFPDIRHQLLEVKHHTGKSITVDFGCHHPASKEAIREVWNSELKYRTNQIRYLIALAPPPDYVVATLILLTGAQMDETFGVSPTKTIKYQMGISRKWREQHHGKILVGGKIW